MITLPAFSGETTLISGFSFERKVKIEKVSYYFSTNPSLNFTINNSIDGNITTVTVSSSGTTNDTDFSSDAIFETGETLTINASGVLGSSGKIIIQYQYVE